MFIYGLVAVFSLRDNLKSVMGQLIYAMKGIIWKKNSIFAEPKNYKINR